MEKDLKIKIPGTAKYIYGKLRGSLKRPLIVFVHGLAGHMNEHIFYNGAIFFEKKGFSSFRFNLYDESKDARKLSKCTLTIHAADLDTVVNHFRRRRVRTLFVVGHSFGGPTILLSKKKDFDGVVLWDPSHERFTSRLGHSLTYVKQLNGYFGEWGTGFILSKRMVEEAKKLKFVSRISDITAPIKIICAGGGMLTGLWRKFYQTNTKPDAFGVISNTDHNFYKEGSAEKLFIQTLDWFRKTSSARISVSR